MDIMDFKEFKNNFLIFGIKRFFFTFSKAQKLKNKVLKSIIIIYDHVHEITLTANRYVKNLELKMKIQVSILINKNASPQEASLLICSFLHFSQIL